MTLHQVLNREELKKLWKALEGHVLYLPVMLASTLGLRRGEALGLRWTDINFKNHTINICNTRTYNGKTDGIIEKLPKSLLRKVVAPVRLLNILLQYKNDTEYVCIWPDGRPLSPTSFSQMFKAAIKNIDIPQIRFHDLRHSHVTLLRNAGVEKEIVMQRVGHSTAEMTEHYTHFEIEKQSSAVIAISDLF